MKGVEDTIKSNDSLSSWVGKISVVKMSVPLKIICRFNMILIKIPIAFFKEIRNPKICVESPKTKNKTNKTPQIGKAM